MSVVLVHGNAGAARTWTRVKDALRGTPVLAPDLPGFGESELHRLPAADLLAEYTGHVLAQAERLAPPVTLVGNGIGGILCAHAALRLGTGVRGVLMTGPVGLRDGHANYGAFSRSGLGSKLMRMTGRTFGRAKYLGDQLAAPAKDAEACSILLDALQRARGFHLLARINEPSSLQGLNALRCPLTIFWGDRDGVLPADHATAFMRLMPSHTKLVIEPDAGHALPLERPERVVALLREIA